MRTLITLVAALGLTLGAIAGTTLAGTATAEANNPRTPVADEPPPLWADNNQAVTVERIEPNPCTTAQRSDGVLICVERAERWECPHGLSRGAIYDTAPTLEPTYNNPNPVHTLAYRDTHCRLIDTVDAYPAPTTPQAPNPTPRIVPGVCATGTQAATTPDGLIQCRPIETPAPRPTFTG